MTASAAFWSAGCEKCSETINNQKISYLVKSDVELAPRRTIRLRKAGKGEHMNALDVSHPVVSKEEWLEARKAFLAEEKEFTRQRDELSRKRRGLPWVKVEKTYVFDGPEGKETLAQLFDGRSQLMIYHFMFGPGWLEGCKGCSHFADNVDGSLIHLAHRDVTFVVVSRAPLADIKAFQKRMGWQFKWVSAYESDFNFDFDVSFTKDELANGNASYNYGTINPFPTEEAPGLSVFYKDTSCEIFHTYSAYARGLDILVETYNLLDHAPKGRDEDNLPSKVAWLRHHDRYDDVIPNERHG